MEHWQSYQLFFILVSLIFKGISDNTLGLITLSSEGKKKLPFLAYMHISE